MEITTLKDYKKALETIKNFKSQCSKCGTKLGEVGNLTHKSRLELLMFNNR